MPTRKDLKAYSFIKEKVINYEFAAPGQHIDIKRLTEELRLSPIPIREMLIRLAEKDLLTSVNGKGFFCREIREDEITMNYDLLAILLFESCKNVITSNTEREISTFTKYSTHWGATTHSLDTAIETPLLPLVSAFCDDLIERNKNHSLAKAFSDALDKTHYFRKLDLKTGEENDFYYTVLRNLSNAILTRNLVLLETTTGRFIEVKRKRVSRIVREAIIKLHDRYVE